jgi:hypothetical protein
MRLTDISILNNHWKPIKNNKDDFFNHGSFFRGLQKKRCYRKAPIILTAKKGFLTFGLSLILFSAMQCNQPVKPPPPPKTDTTNQAFTPVLSATNPQVQDFIASGNGGQHAKLVYIDKTTSEDKLCYIDFSDGSSTPKIHSIAAAVKPKVPVISPDGNWVAYASGIGGEAGSSLADRSSIYLCRIEENAKPVLVAADSAGEPRFKQNVTGKLIIIYPTLTPNWAWEGFGRTMQIDIDVSSPIPIAGTPQALFSQGSYTGGLSWDNRYLCGGGGDIAMLDFQSGVPRPDTLSYNGAQSCNASISSSRNFTNTMMFLTMGSSHPKINGGKKWSTWQVILIINGNRELCKGFVCPATFTFPIETNPASIDDINSSLRWHHCEWSNHPYFATATLNVDRYFKVGADYQNTNYQERIYLINLRDSTFLEVARPDTVIYKANQNSTSGFHWPWLWVEIPAAFQESADWLKPL